MINSSAASSSLRDIPSITAKEVSSAISQQLCKVSNSSDAMNKLGDQQRNVFYRRFNIIEIKHKLTTAKNEKPSVYLRWKNGGVHFSQHKGILVRLGLSDGGYSKAAKALNGCVEPMVLPKAGQCIYTETLLEVLKCDHAIADRQFADLNSRFAAAKSNYNAEVQTLNSLRARLDAVEAQ